MPKSRRPRSWSTHGASSSHPFLPQSTQPTHSMRPTQSQPIPPTQPTQSQHSHPTQSTHSRRSTQSQPMQRTPPTGPIQSQHTQPMQSTPPTGPIQSQHTQPMQSTLPTGLTQYQHTQPAQPTPLIRATQSTHAQLAQPTLPTQETELPASADDGMSDELHDAHVGDEINDGQADVSSARRSRGRGGWNVNVIDNDGMIKAKKLRVDQVWSLDGERVLVQTDDLGRPIGEEGGIFSGAMGHLARTKYAIDYEAWSDIPDSVKDDIFNRLVMPYFRFENDELAKWIANQWIGKRWRDFKGTLYNKHYDPSLTLDQNIEQNCPIGVSSEQWRGLILIRDKQKHKELCRQNAHNRSKQIIPHTAGSKSFARKKNEMEKERQCSIGRVELWDAVHRRSDGSYVNDEARNIGQKLQEASSQLDQTQLSIISPDDAFGQVFGKEHPGRVRGLGMGACPTSVFGSSVEKGSGSSSSTSNNVNQEITILKSQLQKTEARVEAILDYIKSMGTYVPPHLFDHPSADQQDGVDTNFPDQFSPAHGRRSSGGSNQERNVPDPTPSP